jgi:glycosyltransferase involved in cell wall biosynthesis/O-antigen/teichoic acid export membrane protein
MTQRRDGVASGPIATSAMGVSILYLNRLKPSATVPALSPALHACLDGEEQGAILRTTGVNRRVLAALSPASVQAFLRQTGLLLVALGLLNASNYIFHVVVSRLLGPSAYGALASLLAVILVLSVPFGVLQTALAEKTALLRAEGRDQEIAGLSTGALRTMVPYGVVAGVLVLVVGTPLLTIFLHVSAGSAMLLAPYVAASVPLSVAYGILQGQLRFKALTALALANVAFRLLGGVTFVALGLGVSGALLGTVLATLLTIPFAFHLVRVDRHAWRQTRRDIGAVRGGLRTALYGITSFWLLAETDVALARHYLDAHAAGYYSSAGLMARALLFLPSAVGVVAFPRFVGSRGDASRQLRWLRLSTATVAALGALGSAALLVLREPLVTLAFGERYVSGADLLLALAPAMAFLAIVNVLVYFHIAEGSRAYLISLAAVALEIVLVVMFHANAEQIAVIVLVVSSLAAVLQYQAALSICRWRPRLEQDAESGELPALWRPATLDLSVVLPCHNAASGLRSVLTRLLERLEGVESYEVIVVSDGSTDDTVSVAESLDGAPVRVIHYAMRAGKGNALHVGLSEARGRYVAFCDADGDIEADAIEPFLALMRLYEPDIVLGSKRHPLSEVYYPPLRRLLSWTYHKLARLLFRVNVRDTQTGFKLIRRDVLAAVLPRLLEKRYAFDLEFLVVARSLGFRRVLEAPVKIHYRFASQVNVRASAGILADTFAIFYRHYVLNTYRRSDRFPAAASLEEALLASARETTKIANASPRGHKRVLVVNWRDVQHPDAGGAETFVHEVARRWVEQGDEVTLLSSGFQGGHMSTEIDGVRIRRLGRLRTGSFHALVQRELARISGFDVVIESVNTIPFLTPVWRRRLPRTLALVHQLAVDVWDAELPRPMAGLGRRVERTLLQLYRNAPVVAVSQSTRADLLALGFSNVGVVPPGRDEPPDVRDIPKEPVPTFLFVGRLAANKRPGHAIEAFGAIKRELPLARLWVVGAGPLERELTDAAPRDVTFFGRVSRRELFERMARAHGLLVPSVREGWGLVVIEANSVGTPAVGYDVAGLRDSIRAGETGLLAAAGDPESLAANAVSLVGDVRQYGALRRAAIEWADRFSWDATAAQLMSAAEAEGSRQISRQAEEALAAS